MKWIAQGYFKQQYWNNLCEQLRDWQFAHAIASDSQEVYVGN